jgi:hypothetical protein
MSQTKVEAPFIQRNEIFRNKFCNGDFQVHQRFDGSATAASTAYMSFDRIKTLLINTGAAWTVEKETLSVTDLATTGHKQALEVKCTTADTSTGAAEYNAVFFSLEANTLQDLNYGTSAAKSLTVSFWVRSYQTGTFVLTAAKSDSTTYYNPKEYTINASNTWEHKVLTFSPTAGGTSLITSSNGVINNDNGQGMHFYFMLNAGSNYHATNDTWATSGIATSNQTNMMSSTDNHWSITGLQIEAGDQATDFEYIPFDIQLQRCQRYYEKSYNLSVVPGASTTYEGTHLAELLNEGTTTRIKILDSRFSVRKRTAPTMTFYTSDGGASGEINNYSSGADKTISSIGNTSETSIGRYFTMTDAGASNETYEFQYEADAEF